MIQSANKSVHHLFLMQNQPLPVVAQWAVAFAVCVAKWDRRARTRKALAHLDSARLADIGLTPHMAEREFSKHFWQA